MNVEELAKEIFIADNSRLDREDALAEWEVFKTHPLAEYCWSIAEKLQPVLTDVFEAGQDSVELAYVLDEPYLSHSDNPYRSK